MKAVAIDDHAVLVHRRKERLLAQHELLGTDLQGGARGGAGV